MRKRVVSFLSVAIVALACVAAVVHSAIKVSAGSIQAVTLTGYVTDLRCKRNVDADCNRKCLKAGEEPALLVDGSGDLLRLKNVEEAKKYAGAHVEVKGTREIDVISVASMVAK
jgi:ribonuclease HII